MKKSIFKVSLCLLALISLTSCTGLGAESSPSDASSTGEAEFLLDNTQNTAQAKTINGDVAAYLCIPGTEINSPIVDGKNYDDLQSLYDMYNGTYDEVTKTWSGRKNWAKKNQGPYAPGSSMIYGRPDLSSRRTLLSNLVVYGYNIGVPRLSPPAESESGKHPFSYYAPGDYPEGPEFAQLFHFLDQDFAQKHPYIILSTDQENYVFEVFAVSYLEAEAPAKYYSLTLLPSEAYEAAQQAVEHSIWLYPDVSFTSKDKFITLITSTYGYFDDQEDNNQVRFVVTGRLLPEGSAYQESCKVEKNPSPVAPVLNQAE